MRATVSRKSLVLLLLAIAPLSLAQQIQFAEPVDIAVAGSRAQFDAYGRRFSLTLSDNERVLDQLPAQRKQLLQRYRLWRGALDGQPGSWVRLTESAAGVEGAIWDGRELYAVTSYRQAAAQLTTPLAVGPHQTVVYRLSDSRDLLPRDFCALDGADPGAAKADALGDYQALVADLQQAAQGRISQQIEIALIADSDFAAKEADPVAAMLARFNVVEGIFSEQVGLLVMATDVRVVETAADPFTSTSAVTLLEQLGNYRASTPAVRARGLAHLVTGKNLDGTTAGMAYVDAACEVRRGVSLSERSYGTTISALLMAHELGHNLGAPHDGEAGACAATGRGFIMAPSITGYATFSQCSIDVMRASLASASCVTPARFADVGLSTPESQREADGGVPVDLPFEVESGGTLAAADVVLEISLPDDAGLLLESAGAEGGTCTIDGSLARCSFGSLAPGERRTASLRLRGTVAATVSARARLSASNDRMASNNLRLVSLDIRSGIDAAVGIATSATDVGLGAQVEILTDVASLRALPLRDAVLALNLNQAVSSASMPGAQCTVNAYSVICHLPELAPGGNARLTTWVRATQAGPLSAAAQVTAAGDDHSDNNVAQVKAWVQAAQDIDVSASPEAVDLAVGDRQEIAVLVRSRGTEAAGPTVLEVTRVAGSAVLEVSTDSAASCASIGDAAWRCELGEIAAGDARMLRFTARGTAMSHTEIQAVALTNDDGYQPNDAARVRLRIDNEIDVGVLLASGGTGVEDQVIEGEVTLRSDGREAARGATLDIELPAEGRLLDARLHEGADCLLVSPRRARCSLPEMARATQVYARYRAEFAEPGNYEVKFALSTPGDTAAANDVLVRPMLVRPHNDIAVTGALDLRDFVAGQTRESTFTVTTGPRALSAARFVAAHHLPGVEVVSISAASGQCQVTAADGGVCDFVDLLPQAEISVSVTWRAMGSCHEQGISVSVTTAGDVVAGNNSARGRMTVLEPTDLELVVDAPARGVAGESFALPPISVVNGTQVAVGARLEISLPKSVTLVRVSVAGAICSGTAVLRCDFSDLAANTRTTVNLTVRAAQGGHYAGALKLVSLNDTNPANDTGELEFEVSAAATEASGSAASGGGGSLEWLSLVLLALLAGAGPAFRRSGTRSRVS